MADKKISELVELTSLATDDVLPVVDTGSNATKRITAANLSKFPSSVTIPDGSTIGSVSDPDALSIAADGQVTATNYVYVDMGSSYPELGAKRVVSSEDIRAALGISSAGETIIRRSNDTLLENKYARLLANGDFKIDDGNLVLAAGKGINFSAYGSGVDSNLLDDYEEGTFSALTTLTSSNATLISTANRYYTKIGNLVTYNFWAEINFTSTSGYIRLGNLPFSTERVGALASTGQISAGNFARVWSGDSGTFYVYRPNIVQNTTFYVSITARTV